MGNDFIMNRLNIYKTHPAIILPQFATQQAACFDLAYNAAGKHEYQGYNSFNATFTRAINGGNITIMPGDRIMVPTGLIFDIPEGFSVRIHARSGTSLKQGLILANIEGIIDSDYIQETFILITNISENPHVIKNGDRIAQAEMVKKEDYMIWESSTKPFPKTDRVGGMGSTGVATDMIKIPTGQSKNKKDIVIKT